MEIPYMAKTMYVHAFGYNSSEREPIWMKSAALEQHIVGGWHWQILGAIRAEATIWKVAKIMFLSGK